MVPQPLPDNTHFSGAGGREASLVSQIASSGRSGRAETNLPSFATEFVGREEEITSLLQLINDNRLVSLLGPGGIGKTRLAVEVAAQLQTSFPDGIWLVEFATLPDPSGVPSWLAGGLGIREQPQMTPLSALIEALQSKKMLLLFDSCEHIVQGCATVASSLLARCPQLHLLVTSRERFGIMGEVLWRVRPLSIPASSSPPSHTLLDPQAQAVDEQTMQATLELLRYEAVQLFLKRAATVAPDFVLTAENAGGVAHICQSLDGLPLALELAAARMSMFSVEQLAARLHERFRLLTQGDPTAAARQQTLQATLDWSYSLLSPIEQLVFDRLSIFGGSWTLEAVEGICSDEATTNYELSDVLSRLVDKSLVVAEMAGEQMRYRLLETIRDYALRQFQEKEQVARWYRRHWDWYTRLAEEAATHEQGAQHRHWMRSLEYESDNLRRAIKRSLVAGAIDTTARIVCALAFYWIALSQLNEGRHWHDTVLAHPDLSQSRRAQVLQPMVEILRLQGEYERSRTLLEERLALLRELRNPLKEAEALCTLGWLAFSQGSFEEANMYCRAGLRIFQDANDPAGIANGLYGLALTATMRGEYAQALTWLQEVLVIRRTLRDQIGLAHCLNAQARAALLDDHYELAHQACREALMISSTIKQAFSIAPSLESIAALASALHRPAQAAQLFGAAHTLRTSTGSPLAPSLRALRERELLTLKIALGEETFAEHWTQGQHLSQQQASLEARKQLDQLASLSTSTSHDPKNPDAPSGLSKRELEVLRLVASGLTDAQVAEKLVLSPRTVSTHLSSIYRKLDVTSRQAATRLALEQRLV